MEYISDPDVANATQVQGAFIAIAASRNNLKCLVHEIALFGILRPVKFLQSGGGGDEVI